MAAVRHIINHQEIRVAFLRYREIRKKGVIEYKSAAKLRNKYLPGDKQQKCGNYFRFVGKILRNLLVLTNFVKL
jgi:hypothetical protein